MRLSHFGFIFPGLSGVKCSLRLPCRGGEIVYRIPSTLDYEYCDFRGCYLVIPSNYPPLNGLLGHNVSGNGGRVGINTVTYSLSL